MLTNLKRVQLRTREAHLSLSLSQSFKAQTSKIGRCSHTWAVGAGSPCQSEPAHMNTPPWMDGV